MLCCTTRRGCRTGLSEPGQCSKGPATNGPTDQPHCAVNCCLPQQAEWICTLGGRGSTDGGADLGMHAMQCISGWCSTAQY